MEETPEDATKTQKYDPEEGDRAGLVWKQRERNLKMRKNTRLMTSRKRLRERRTQWIPSQTTNGLAMDLISEYDAMSVRLGTRHWSHLDIFPHTSYTVLAGLYDSRQTPVHDNQVPVKSL